MEATPIMNEEYEKNRRARFERILNEVQNILWQDEFDPDDDELQHLHEDILPTLVEMVEVFTEEKRKAETRMDALEQLYEAAKTWRHLIAGGRNELPLDAPFSEIALRIQEVGRAADAIRDAVDELEEIEKHE